MCDLSGLENIAVFVELRSRLLKYQTTVQESIKRKKGLNISFFCNQQSRLSVFFQLDPQSCLWETVGIADHCLGAQLLPYRSCAIEIMEHLQEIVSIYLFDQRDGTGPL